MSDQPSRWRAAWYSLLERSPRAYCWYLRRVRRAPTVVRSESVVVLEGYPGSGNTFAREATLLLNQGVHVGSHIHRPAHVLRALQLGKPVVVTVRDPVGAIPSYLARFPERPSLAAALADYERFHRALLPSAGAVIVVPFERVVQRWGEVMEEVNRRYGTSLTPFDHNDPALVDLVLAVIDGWSREVFGADAANRRAAPSEERERKLEVIRAELMAPELDAALARCRGLHAQWLALATG